MEGALIVVLVVALLRALRRLRTAVVVPQQSAYVVERLGRYHATLNAGFHLLVPVRRRHSVSPQPEGDGLRHRRAGLHHARQRAGGRRRRPVSEGAEPRARVVRHLRLPVRHHAARADDAAQRGRQDRSRSDLRGTHHDQHAGRRRAGQGVGGVGREGPALRDQEHHAAGTTFWPRWKSRCAPSARSAR